MLKERWIEYTKKADFDLWSRELQVSKLCARIMRNRGIETLREAEQFLRGRLSDLSDPHLMKDMDRGVSLLSAAIRAGGKIAICSDFDDDGIFAGQILYEGIRNCGGTAILFTPNRVQEGYGLNRRIIDEAADAGCSLLLTCDNGIAAIEEAAYAKEKGLTVIITDHHEVQYREEPDGERAYLLPPADAVIDPKQPGCSYPFKELCGAGVAFRMIGLLYEEFSVPAERLEELLEYVAIATVADVVPLQGENRILVRAGLLKLHATDKLGLLALFEACGLRKEQITAYHLGFVIGPCFNAVGRLSDVRLAFDLLNSTDEQAARELSVKIRGLNEQRKEETERGVSEAEALLEQGDYAEDRVLLLRLRGIHESVVGIVAGRLKEKLYRPVFVFTDAEGGIKGSGRSIEAYHMMDALIPEKPLLTRFGGHKMAAGLSLSEENLPALRKALNAHCSLTEEELSPVIRIDARVPFRYLTEALVSELSLLAPYGTGNPRPVFAMPHVAVCALRMVGQKRTVLRMSLRDEFGTMMQAVYFGDAEKFLGFIDSEFGREERDRAMRNQENRIDLAFTFYPDVNEYQGRKSIQIVCMSYCRIR